MSITKTLGLLYMAIPQGLFWDRVSKIKIYQNSSLLNLYFFIRYLALLIPPFLSGVTNKAAQTRNILTSSRILTIT